MLNQVPDNRSECCEYQHLVDIVCILRDPVGCPWDVEQTHKSLQPNLLEEVYETLEAIEKEDVSGLEEELGDLMIQIVFHADIARRNGDFNAASVCSRVSEKIIRRHPHVFGDAEKFDSGADVVDAWERIKRQEAGGIRSIVASVPEALPALAQSAILQRRSMRAGLDPELRLGNYSNFSGKRLDESDDNFELRAGEFLAAVVRRFQEQGIDAETALMKVNATLRERVMRAEELADGADLSELPARERDRIWEITS